MFSDTRPSLLERKLKSGEEGTLRPADPLRPRKLEGTSFSHRFGKRPPFPALTRCSVQKTWRCFHSLWDGVFGSLDLAEELLRDAVVEGELPVQHGEKDHAQGPHVTGLPAIGPTCRKTSKLAGLAELPLFCLSATQFHTALAVAGSKPPLKERELCSLLKEAKEAGREKSRRRSLPGAQHLGIASLV